MTATAAKTTSVALVGVGGQGIVLMGDVLAHAMLYAGCDVKSHEIHGMAQRGGSVLAQVRFGAKVASPTGATGGFDYLLGLEKLEALRYAHLLAADGVALVADLQLVPLTAISGGASYPEDIDSRLAARVGRLHVLDIFLTAHALGNLRTANVVMLGAFASLAGLERAPFAEAIARRVKPRYQALNQKALEAGWRLTRDLQPDR
jgi:indolepyruvate ferredoxin oxidoreductase beta subunit